MEATLVEHFKSVNPGSRVILSCKHVSRATGIKQRKIFRVLNKSDCFTNVDGHQVGFNGYRYNFFTLNNC